MNEQIKDIEDRVNKTEEFLDELGDYIDNNFNLPGYREQKYNLKQWKKQFNVRIPEEINFLTLAALFAEVAKKYQQASFFRDRQQVQLAVLEQNRSQKYNYAYNQTRRESEATHKKPLAAESCKVAATIVVKDLDEALDNQKVIKDFWDSTCKTLTEMRKILEGIGFALSGDARINRELNIRGKE